MNGPPIASQFGAFGAGPGGQGGMGRRRRKGGLLARLLGLLDDAGPAAAPAQNALLSRLAGGGGPGVSGGAMQMPTSGPMAGYGAFLPKMQAPTPPSPTMPAPPDMSTANPWGSLAPTSQQSSPAYGGGGFQNPKPP